jgi:hypothetical protein
MAECPVILADLGRNAEAIELEKYCFCRSVLQFMEARKKSMS